MANGTFGPVSSFFLGSLWLLRPLPVLFVFLVLLVALVTIVVGFPLLAPLSFGTMGWLFSSRSSSLLMLA